MQSIRVLLFSYTLFMFRIFSSSGQIFTSTCRKDALFVASARDKKQTNGLISAHNITRLSLCAKKCTSTATCMTINYKIQTSSSQDLNCELLNTNISSSLSVAAGWVHYKPVIQVGPRCRVVTCDPGYECKETCATQVGYECIDINECQSNPCLNGATCQNLVNSYSCTCVPGYGGTNCQTDINECASTPCKNGGTCSDGLNQYTCACVSGYIGTNCENTPTPGSWVTGDGTGGIEVNIGAFSDKEACLRECSKRTNNGIYANGATVNAVTGSVSCFCEFGMTSRSGTSYISAFISPSCTTYNTLSDASRHITQTGVVNCDSALAGSYRFMGSAGTMMPTSCVTKLYCSTHAPGWMQGTHPTQAEGVVDRTVCFNYSGNCCVWNRAIKVRNCGSFYVYELVSTTCSLRYCGTG